MLIFYYISYILGITRKYCDNNLFDDIIKDFDELCSLYDVLNDIQDGSYDKLRNERIEVVEIIEKSYPIVESAERRKFMKTLEEYRNRIDESKFKKPVKDFFIKTKGIEYLIKKYNLKYITGEIYQLYELEIKDEYEKLLRDNKSYSLAIDTKNKSLSIQELNNTIEYIEKHIDELDSESKIAIICKIELIRKYLSSYPNDKAENYKNTLKNLIQVANSKNPNFIKSVLCFVLNS